MEYLLASRLCFLLYHYAALFDTSLLTSELAEVVNFSATHATVLVDHDAVDEWRFNWEDTFYANVLRHLANGETLLVAFTADFDNNTTILLDTFLVTLFNAVSHCDSVAREECRKFLLGSKCLLYNFN